MRSKQWYTKTSRLEYSFAKSYIGRRSSDRVLTTRSSVRRPVESKFQICLASCYRKCPRGFQPRCVRGASENPAPWPRLTCTRRRPLGHFIVRRRTGDSNISISRIRSLRSSPNCARAFTHTYLARSPPHPQADVRPRILIEIRMRLAETPEWGEQGASS